MITRLEILHLLFWTNTYIKLVEDSTGLDVNLCGYVWLTGVCVRDVYHTCLQAKLLLINAVCLL